MSQAKLARILNEVSTLEREELYRIQEAVQAQLTRPLGDGAEERFLQAMLEAGLITDIKHPDRSRSRERPLVPIAGEPISETIIEERR